MFQVIGDKPGLHSVPRYGFTVADMTNDSMAAESWAPEACTLPTQQRPLRIAEFDELFTEEVSEVQRTAPDLALLYLRPEPAVAARAADLSVRETGCCSFFEFSLVATGGHLTLQVRTPPEHVAVLDALVERARTASARRSR